MKKYIIVTVVVLYLCPSCKKEWLEIIPQGSLVASTVNDYDKIMNGSVFYMSLGGGWQELQLMGDELAAETPYFANLSAVKDNMFRWADTIWAANDPFAGMALTDQQGVGHTKIMLVTNKVISEVMTAAGGTEE